MTLYNISVLAMALFVPYLIMTVILLTLLDSDDA